MSEKLRTGAYLAAMLFLAADAVTAQTGGGATLVGTVTDQTGVLVAGAKLTAVNTATAFYH